jgi:hypothetical protein
MGSSQLVVFFRGMLAAQRKRNGGAKEKREVSGGQRGVGGRIGTRALEWNHRAIKCVAFDHALQQLAGGGLDGTVMLWDTVEGKLLRTLRRLGLPWRRFGTGHLTKKEPRRG